MPVFSNEEEKKRRKIVKAPSFTDTLKTTSKTSGDEAQFLSAPARVSYAGLKETGRMLRQGMRSAANETTMPSKAGSAARTLVTTPVAYVAGAGKQLYREVAPIVKGAGEFYRSFVGKKKVPNVTSNRVQAPPTNAANPAARVATQQLAAAPEPTLRTAPASPAPASRVSPVGVPGSGSITTSSGGAARIDPATGEITVTGNPLRADSTRLPTNVKAPERRRPTSMVTHGGYRLSDHTEAQPEPEIRRVSDIPPPATFGDIPGYNKQVRAAMADAATEKFEAGQAQQQDQFEQGQSQAAAIAMQRQAQQQNQFEQNKALDERRVAGTERQQQLAADQQAAKLAAEQRREGRAVAKEKEISAARAKFEAADTPAEKVAAAQILNSLQGMKIDTPKKGKPPGLTPKETSQQIQGALKAFESAGGEAAVGTDFYTWMRQNDTRGYQAAFGNLTPKDIRVNARINELTDEQLMSSDIAGAMNPGETPAQFRQRLAFEYQSKRGY